MKNKFGEVELSSLVTLFQVNERTQEMMAEYFPWRLTLKHPDLDESLEIWPNAVERGINI